MCTDVCPCIHGCSAIFNCAQAIENDISNLQQDHAYLSDKRPDLQHKIREVRERYENGDASDLEWNWLRSAENEERLLGDILGSEGSPKPLPSCCLCCHLHCCGNLGREMNERKVRLDRLLGDERLQQINGRIQTPLVVPLALVEMIGMDAKFQEFWQLFDDDSDPPIIGVHGMPGAGKSAFLVNVNNEFTKLEYRRDFEKVIWVGPSSTRNIDILQRTIAERLGLVFPPNITTEVLGGDICRELNRTNFVLLLDNLPDELELSAIGVPHPTAPGNVRKGKIVFTAQRSGIWGNLSPRAFDLGLLDRQSASLLFNSKVGEETLKADTRQQAQAAGDSASRTIRQLASTVVGMCSGLPVALVTIGEHMRNKNSPAEWSDIIDRLKCPERAGPEESVYRCLSSAYTSLSLSATQVTQVESMAQKCFLYCCLFPGGHPIEEEELKRHWLAEEFLGNDDDLHRCLGRGDSILNTPKRAHLLMSARDQPAIEMHLQIYNLARWISSGHLPEGSQNNFYVQSKSNAEMKELPRDHNWAQVERISLVEATVGALNKIECSRLSTLILKNCIINNMSRDFFDYMAQLKVLNLSQSKLPMIPKGIAWLTSLRYLNLSGSNVSELSNDFNRLTKLVVLDLSFTEELVKIAAGVFSKLSALTCTIAVLDEGPREEAAALSRNSWACWRKCRGCKVCRI